MKLYLSSYRIPNAKALYGLVDKSPEEIHVAVIPNAKDYYADRARLYKVNDFVKYLQALGIGQIDVVDLRDFHDPHILEEKLSGYDLLWVCGGNTFCLRYEMQRSGFDTIIKSLLENGLIYGGDSAGALVAGPSIKGVELADIPQFAEKVIEDGLHLVPYYIVPHVGSAEYGVAIEKMLVLVQAEPYIALTDSQAVIFESSQHTIVSV